MDSEEPVFEAVINWVKHAKKEREESLPDLLQYVRMPLLTPRYITDVIDAEVSPGRHRVPSLTVRQLSVVPAGSLVISGRHSLVATRASWNPILEIGFHIRS